MKKKLVVAIALILLLAVSLTMLVGCDQIFKKNEERDATQIVATVTYDGMTAYVMKYELASSFNNYAYAYHNYYGMSYEEAADYLCRSLAQQKLLGLYARTKVAELEGTQRPASIKDQLSANEYAKAVKNTNDNLLSSLKTLVKESITEDNYNNGTAVDNEVSEEEEEEETEITDAVYVRFDSDGGSAVEKQKLQKGKKAHKPADPTKDGYTFYGWHLKNDGALVDEEYDFATPVVGNVYLYAKWVKYTAPRTEMPEPEKEDEDKDYDPDGNDMEVPALFFNRTALDLLKEFDDEEYINDMIVPADSNRDDTLKGYIEDALVTLKTNLKNNLYLGNAEECYNYYLDNQMETLLITKLQRLLGQVNVSEAEIEEEFNRIVAQNKETFIDGSSAYSSALTSKLNQTYYHAYTTNSYGFVVNILIKLGDEALAELTDMYKENPSNKDAIEILRNRLISEISVKVSNPAYKSKEVVKDSEGKEIDLRDPMTDEKNPYNNVNKTPDTSFQKENQADGYNQIVSFVKNGETGEYEIVYGATEHPAMAYLLEEVPAFDKDGKVGVIHQIYNSFKMVTDAVAADDDLSLEQGVYWLREVANKWVYLVGDDSGAASSDSNNGGLGYLITPEGEDSSYLEDFTTYARALISNGTGSYVNGTVDADTFNPAEADGSMAGNQVAYVVADSFLASGNTSNAYAGVFVLLNSCTVWDNEFYKATHGDNELAADGVLPIDYVVTYAKDQDDIKTIRDIIEESVKDTKKDGAYSEDVNAMGIANYDTIVYNKKAYKSLWDGLKD